MAAYPVRKVPEPVTRLPHPGAPAESRGFLAALLGTHAAWPEVALRVGLAVVMFPHGAQKLLGWFGGYGFSASMGYFTQTMHIPAFLAFLAIVTEFFGPIALVLGLFTRLAALATGIDMLVAVALVHAPNGFFMNWFGNQAGEGYEYHLLVIAMAIALLVGGGGRWSVDRAIARHLGTAKR